MTADQKRVRITRILVLVFLMVSILMCIFGVQFEKAILPAVHSTNITFLDQHRFVIILILGYCCAAALLIMLVTMYRFLKRIETGMLFTAENIKALQIISQCCLAGGALTLLIAILYTRWLLVITIAAWFMMLIVRIVESAFARALAMKDELDLTI
ncbi:MAG: DUF2975 domain-containing protein [Solobacterium sp.]|jgi:hypothetical protein|nr:DUF2975 domain-containing protein [Solobacterium sp.]MCH4266723.1 DUF2975 domain-containing protein [Solobacterium sp.]